MKKLSILIFLAVILLFTGCSQKLDDGILKVDKVYKEKNSKTKVYYEDLSEKFVVEANKKIVEDLNSSDIIPIKWYTLANQKEATGITNSKYTSIENDLRKKVENGKFKVSNDGTKIVFEKQYINIGKAVSSIKDILGNDNHPLSSEFDKLSENEQDDILDVVKFIEKLEVKVC